MRLVSGLSLSVLYLQPPPSLVEKFPLVEMENSPPIDTEKAISVYESPSDGSPRNETLDFVDDASMEPTKS